MDEKSIILGIVGATILIIGGGAWLSSGSDKAPKMAGDGDVVVRVEESTHDWGEIPIDGGKVEKNFDIKNDGSGTLELFNVSTSCMCTIAQLVMGDRKSPEFGMHGKSSYVLKVPGGETAQVKVVYDPAFHGPSGVGPIDRRVKVETNDPDKQELSFALTAVVKR